MSIFPIVINLMQSASPAGATAAKTRTHTTHTHNNRSQHMLDMVRFPKSKILVTSYDANKPPFLIAR